MYTRVKKIRPSDRNIIHPLLGFGLKNGLEAPSQYTGTNIVMLKRVEHLKDKHQS